MLFESAYTGRSGAINGVQTGRVGFATNTLREATYFVGTLANPLLLREAFAALYHVVVSDYKYRPRDRVEFQTWLEEQDRKFLANLPVKGAKINQRLEELELRLAELEDARQQRRRPYYRARRSFFNYIYENEYELTLLLDPVITVHPDEISFEAFSRDESTYGRIAAKYDLFQHINSFECGTTNIDFSLGLHNELERMRSYRRTHFSVDPGGFTVSDDTGTTLREKKIDLPESWLQGFLQVHATMSMGLTHVRLAPVDLFNICRSLRKRKAKHSPRALRYELKPGEPGKVVLEPWEHEIPLTINEFQGPKPLSIRTWGRDRLQTLARLLPVCQRVDVFLAGWGLPSFYVLDLGPVIFTLALSGWTDNDWTGETKFDLLTRRVSVKADELLQVYQVLRTERFATDTSLAEKSGLGLEKCRSAVSFLCQAGRAMVDLGENVLRHRDLLFTPFTQKEADALLGQSLEEKNPTAKAARVILDQGNARFTARRPVSTGYKLSGSVRGTDGKRVRPLLSVDHEGRIIEATCTCSHFNSKKMTQGPCEHMLALRLAHMERLEAEDRA